MIGIIIAAGIMAAISAYLLFKIVENKGDDEYKLSSALQALFFFIIIANFVVMGSAAFESRNDCEYLLNNSVKTNEIIYKYGNNFSGYHWDYTGTEPNFNPATLNDPSTVFLFHTTNTETINNTYDYVCTERNGNSAGWIYKLPIWLAYASVLYLILYFLMLLYDLYKQFKEDKRG